MPLIATDNSMTNGHCWPQAKLKAILTLPDRVFVGTMVPARGPGPGPHGMQPTVLHILVEGDTTSIGTHGGTCGDKPDHAVVLDAGSTDIFINGKSIIRQGDPTLCGDSVGQVTQTSVFANEGSSQTQGSPFVPTSPDPGTSPGPPTGNNTTFFDQ